MLEKKKPSRRTSGRKKIFGGEKEAFKIKKEQKKEAQGKRRVVCGLNRSGSLHGEEESTSKKNPAFRNPKNAQREPRRGEK